MENNKVKRQMNFELLRIFCIVFIILHHYAQKGGIINIDSICINKFIGEFMYFGGKLGVIIFVFISGYFLADSKYKFKNLFKIIFEVLFYSIVIYMILVICGKIDFSIKDLIKSILPISYNQYWFMTSYIGMYMCVPFINKLIKNINKFEYTYLIIVGGIMFVIIPTIIIGGGTQFATGIIYFIYLYMLASYLKIYNIKWLDTRKKCSVLIIIILVVMMLVSIISTYLGQYYSIFNKGITYLANGNSITIVLLAIGIFQLFRYTEIKYNIIIEKLAQCSLAVYLIHDNPYLRNILWNDILKTQNYYYTNTCIFILHVVFSVIFIYGLSTIFDLIRKQILEKNVFDRLYIKILDGRLKKIEKKLTE